MSPSDQSVASGEWRHHAVVGGFACSLLILAHVALAGEKVKVEERVIVKQVQGVVSAVSSQGIAVEYARTKVASQEMYLPFVPQVRVQGVKRVTDLQVGDTVAVEYREVASEDEHGEYTKINRVATGIALIARAPQQPVAVSDEGSDAKSQ